MKCKRKVGSQRSPPKSWRLGVDRTGSQIRKTEGGPLGSPCGDIALSGGGILADEGDVGPPCGDIPQQDEDNAAEKEAVEPLCSDIPGQGEEIGSD